MCFNYHNSREKRASEPQTDSNLKPFILAPKAFLTGPVGWKIIVNAAMKRKLLWYENCGNSGSYTKRILHLIFYILHGTLSHKRVLMLAKIVQHVSSKLDKWRRFYWFSIYIASQQSDIENSRQIANFPLTVIRGKIFAKIYKAKK